MVIAQATRIRMILRKTPLKVYSNLKVNSIFAASWISVYLIYGYLLGRVCLVYSRHSSTFFLVLFSCYKTPEKRTKWVLLFSTDVSQNNWLFLTSFLLQISSFFHYAVLFVRIFFLSLNCCLDMSFHFFFPVFSFYICLFAFIFRCFLVNVKYTLYSKWIEILLFSVSSFCPPKSIGTLRMHGGDAIFPFVNKRCHFRNT